ncbi:hypothetical protein M6B38_273245 [Iris pallida]|uniref:Uncharacterized protein n=1 Tax=Iris pallida TaxID=29817 RepID=A0AAX6I645_IRIPA|nr:hypothetical protein M6B38_273245 [Iris pallida]
MSFSTFYLLVYADLCFFVKQIMIFWAMMTMHNLVTSIFPEIEFQYLLSPSSFYLTSILGQFLVTAAYVGLIFL